MPRRPARLSDPHVLSSPHLVRPPSTPDPISLVRSHWSPSHSARGHVPDPRRVVVGPRRHPPPVRRPSHAEYRISVPFERADEIGRAHV